MSDKTPKKEEIEKKKPPIAFAASAVEIIIGGDKQPEEGKEAAHEAKEREAEDFANWVMDDIKKEEKEKEKGKLRKKREMKWPKRSQTFEGRQAPTGKYEINYDDSSDDDDEIIEDDVIALLQTNLKTEKDRMGAELNYLYVKIRCI